MDRSLDHKIDKWQEQIFTSIHKLDHRIPNFPKSDQFPGNGAKNLMRYPQVYGSRISNTVVLNEEQGCRTSGNCT